MRVLVQRVSRAAVHVDGETVAAIGPGLLLFAAFRSGDGETDL
ncbi:MAG: D-aminoacyl-tRNA deacylase, partial [candidate division NC10 bacterium]|nr:D-aminoacyl-tRNA deacylase [candidate division NC10 bacterium]